MDENPTGDMPGGHICDEGDVLEVRQVKNNKDLFHNVLVAHPCREWDQRFGVFMIRLKKIPSFVRTFQGRFVDLVKQNIKKQTVRKTPKRMMKPGDIIDCRMWEGKPYHSEQIKLMESIITEVSEIEIYLDQTIISNLANFSRTRIIGGLNEFAKSDGFIDWNDMIAWFNRTHGLPFKGVLIKWGEPIVYGYKPEDVS